MYLVIEQGAELRGVTTLTNAVSGQSQNCSGNLEISPGIGKLGYFSGKHAIIPGHCRQKSGHRRNFHFTFLFRITSASRHSPLQKRERTGKEYGCFPFV